MDGRLLRPDGCHRCSDRSRLLGLSITERQGCVPAVAHGGLVSVDRIAWWPRSRSLLYRARHDRPQPARVPSSFLPSSSLKERSHGSILYDPEDQGSGRFGGPVAGGTATNGPCRARSVAPTAAVSARPVRVGERAGAGPGAGSSHSCTPGPLWRRGTLTRARRANGRCSSLGRARHCQFIPGPRPDRSRAAGRGRAVPRPVRQVSLRRRRSHHPGTHHPTAKGEAG